MARPAAPTGTKATVNGYIRVKLPDHPLAVAGWVREHRAVLYEAIGPGAHPCYRCRKLVTWGQTLEVEPRNHDRADNRVQNLAPACRGCQNATRRGNGLGV